MKGGGEKKENLSKSFLPICITLNIIMFYILKFTGILTIILKEWKLTVSFISLLVYSNAYFSLSEKNSFFNFFGIFFCRIEDYLE